MHLVKIARGWARIKYGGFDRYLIEHYFYHINEPIRSLLVPITWFKDILIKYDLILKFSKFLLKVWSLETRTLPLPCNSLCNLSHTSLAVLAPIIRGKSSSNKPTRRASSAWESLGWFSLSSFFYFSSCRLRHEILL